MKEKQDKAIAELQDFFNKWSDEESNSNDSNEFMDIVKPRGIEVYTKDGKRKKRFGELESLKYNPLTKKCSDNTTNTPSPKKKRKRIWFEDYQITHVIGKGGSAVVKLATHITKKTNVVFKIYEKAQMKQNQMRSLRTEIKLMK